MESHFNATLPVCVLLEQPDSLVERIFDHPDNICQGEYYVIHDFLLNLEDRDEPEAIACALEEFAGWAVYMLKKMHQAGLIDRSELYESAG